MINSIAHYWNSISSETKQKASALSFLTAASITVASAPTLPVLLGGSFLLAASANQVASTLMPETYSKALQKVGVHNPLLVTNGLALASCVPFLVAGIQLLQASTALFDPLSLAGTAIIAANTAFYGVANLCGTNFFAQKSPKQETVGISAQGHGFARIFGGACVFTAGVCLGSAPLMTAGVFFTTDGVIAANTKIPDISEFNLRGAAKNYTEAVYNVGTAAKQLVQTVTKPFYPQKTLS